MTTINRKRGLMRARGCSGDIIAKQDAGFGHGKWANTCDVNGCAEWGKWNSRRWEIPDGTEFIFLICEGHIKEDLKIST